MSEALTEGKVKAKRKSEYSFDPTSYINALTGVDLSGIYGLGPGNLLTIVSECGTDMEKWPTAKHFTSWLGLAPQNKISGGRVLSSRTRPGSSRAGSALWMAALIASRSQTAIGAFSRRLAIRRGKPKAHVATTRKIADLSIELFAMVAAMWILALQTTKRNRGDSRLPASKGRLACWDSAL